MTANPSPPPGYGKERSMLLVRYWRIDFDNLKAKGSAGILFNKFWFLIKEFRANYICYICWKL